MESTVGKGTSRNIDAFESIDEAGLASATGGNRLGDVIHRTLTASQDAAQQIRNVAHPVTVLNNVKNVANRVCSFVESRRSR